MLPRTFGTVFDFQPSQRERETEKERERERTFTKYERIRLAMNRRTSDIVFVK